MPLAIGVQRRMMELGRVRLGQKTASGAPKKLDTFRFTSASKVLLDAVAALHGGTVRAWEGAPDEGMYEVVTGATELNIILPPVYSDQDGTPTVPYSQWFEHWSAGGCQRRCDGITESIGGKPCACAATVEAQGEQGRTCKVTTRVSFMLPDVPGLGVWRIDSHGWNAAVELPTTLDVLVAAAREHRFIPAVLGLQKRTKKTGGKTHRFVVPVVTLQDVTVMQLASGEAPNLLAFNPPPLPARRGERAALPAGPAIPDSEEFDHDQVEFGPAATIEPTEHAQLAAHLIEVADALGAKESAVASVAKNLEAHAGELEKHVEWLNRQIATLEKNLAETQPSVFEEMAAKAQGKVLA